MIEPVLELSFIVVLVAVVALFVLGSIAVGLGVALVIKVLRKISKFLGWIP